MDNQQTSGVDKFWEMQEKVYKRAAKRFLVRLIAGVVAAVLFLIGVGIVIGKYLL